MIVEIISNKSLYMAAINHIEESSVIEEFSARVPNYMFIDSGSGFDGWYRRYNKSKRILPRPFLGRLIKLCYKKKYSIKVIDKRPSDDIQYNITKDMLDGITLEDYQVRAIEAACKSEVGCIQSPTGSGKTEMIAAITKTLDKPTVIIAEQKVVIDQVTERLKLRKVVEEVGMFYAGKRPSGQMIIVGSIQSLLVGKPPAKSSKNYQKKIIAHKTRRKNAKFLRDAVSNCDVVIVDEADRASSTMYKKLFRYWFKGRYRYGFSGTFNDPKKPVENLFVNEHLGSIICKIPRSEVEKAGRIIPVSYFAMVFGDKSGRQDRSTLDAATKEHINTNDSFHKLIGALCDRHTSKGEGVLILIHNIELGEQLESKIPSSAFICGSTPDTKRKDIISKFENREINVLIGSKIVDRGLDLKNGCEVLILASGGKLHSNFMQRIGRALRLNNKGRSVVYDFLFFCNYYLYKHSRERLKAINDLDYPSKVVFPDGIIDVNKFIKSNFRIPKF